MKTKRFVLYPFSSDTLPLVLYLKQLRPEYEILSLVSPSGMGINEKDAAWADNRSSIGLTVSTQFEKALENADALLVAPGKLDDILHKHTLDVIAQAIRNSKDVDCMLTLPEQLREEISRSASQNKVTFKYWGNGDEIIDSMICEPPLALYEPHCPVIMIGSLAENANAFEVFLAVANEFQQQGFFVSALGCTNYCEIFKLHSLPDFLGHGDIDNNSKVKFLNAFIRNLVRNEKPDILVIQIPGSMLKYNSILTTGFGIDAFLVSLAVQADYFVCCTPFQTYGKTFAENTSRTFSERFGFGIDAFHMSNQFVDLSDSYLDKRLIYTHVESEKVDEFIKTVYSNENASKDMPVFNILNEKSKRDFLHFLLEKAGSESFEYQKTEEYG